MKLRYGAAHVMVSRCCATVPLLLHVTLAVMTHVGNQVWLSAIVSIGSLCVPKLFLQQHSSFRAQPSFDAPFLLYFKGKSGFVVFQH